MTKIVNATVEILGKAYTIRCPETETYSLHQAAEYLNSKMQELNASGKVLGMEKIIIITALNIAHRLLALEAEKDKTASTLQERITSLFSKVDHVLAVKPQMELLSAE